MRVLSRLQQRTLQRIVQAGGCELIQREVWRVRGAGADPDLPEKAARALVRRRLIERRGGPRNAYRTDTGRCRVVFYLPTVAGRTLSVLLGPYSRAILDRVRRRAPDFEATLQLGI